MINIQNLGLQESVGVKYIDDIRAKFCLKLWFEGDWYFCYSTESRWFYMRSRNKVPSYQFIKSAQKQPYAMFFKIVALKNVTQVFSHDYKIFKNSVFIENLQWLFFSVRLSNCSALAISWPSLLNQKHNVAWSLLKRSLDLFRVRYIISRTHSNTILLTNLPETKTCPR